MDQYVEVDSPDFRKGDLRALPFEKESVDYVVCNNVLEHLPMADVPMAIYEIRRILKVGGRAVILVPDFAWICQKWLEMESMRFHPYSYRWLAEEVYGNQIHEGEFHRAPFSPGYMNYVLQMCGFIHYTLTKYPANGPVPDLPGVVSLNPRNTLRSDLLVADITK